MAGPISACDFFGDFVAASGIILLILSLSVADGDHGSNQTKNPRPFAGRGFSFKFFLGSTSPSGIALYGDDSKDCLSKVANHEGKNTHRFHPGQAWIQSFGSQPAYFRERRSATETSNSHPTLDIE
jgi:hypothetical protein